MPEASIPPVPLFPAARHHLDLLSTELGIWQHASMDRPDPAFGFCIDDVARALNVDLLHSRELGWEAVSPSVRRHLTFIEQAAGAPGRRFRNFRAADGAWLEDEGSEDSHGRAMWSLACAMSDAVDPSVREAAGRLFEQALPAARSLRALRAIASTVLACDRAIEAGAGANAEATFELLTGRIATAFGHNSLAPDWRWPEPILTYENALLPRSLIVAGRRLGDASVVRGGCLVLDWLIEVQTGPNGTFSPVGNRGWWPRQGAKSQFDQQPIEAMAMVLAAETALAATADERYGRAAEMAYAWFLGANDGAREVAVPITGGCRDGLTAYGLNHNQGAESTLAWLTALEHIRAMRAAGAGVAVPSAIGSRS
ncbi:MAG: hypothetical protein ACXWN4_02555 [Candidatus Limnocylindrales bacterium]